MPHISTTFEEKTSPKVHFSQYILTESKPEEDDDTAAPAQPEHPEAE